MVRDRGILLLAIGQTLAWAGLYYSFPALLLRWEQALGWSKADLTGAITLAVLISGFVSPFTGRIIDKGHGPALMAFSAVLGGVGMLLLSSITTLWQFYAIWAAIGLAMSGCLYEPCFALITRARGAQAKGGIILITLFAGFASTISFPVAHVLARNFGWRLTVILFGLMAIVIVAPLLWSGACRLETGRRTDVQPTIPQQDTGNKFLQNPAFWFLAMGFALLAIVHSATLHHLLPILDEHGWSAEMAVLAASFIGPMQIAGRLAMTVSQKFTSHHGVAISAFVMLGIAVFVLKLSPTSVMTLAVSIIFFGGAYGTVSILRPLIARDILGTQNFGAKSGALALPYLVGAASAPFLGSVIWEFGGYDTMLNLLVTLVVIGCVMYIISHRIARKFQK